VKTFLAENYIVLILLGSFLLALAAKWLFTYELIPRDDEEVPRG
jgi:hypothetical protein